MIFGTIPSEIEGKLYDYSDWFFSNNLQDTVTLDEGKITAEYAVSDEYLKELMAREDVIGFPEESYGADFRDITSYDTKTYFDRVCELDKELTIFTGSRTTALQMYYPPGGYIGWHNNSNASGYNILFTFSETGEGDFRYIHPQTGELVIMPDKKGWSCKIGFFDVIDGNPLWHSAWTGCNRLTWSYIVHPMLWDNLAEEIGVDRDAVMNIIGRDPKEYIVTSEHY